MDETRGYSLVLTTTKQNNETSNHKKNKKINRRILFFYCFINSIVWHFRNFFTHCLKIILKMKEIQEAIDELIKLAEEIEELSINNSLTNQVK